MLPESQTLMTSRADDITLRPRTFAIILTLLLFTTITLSFFAILFPRYRMITLTPLRRCKRRKLSHCHIFKKIFRLNVSPRPHRYIKKLNPSERVPAIRSADKDAQRCLATVRSRRQRSFSNASCLTSM